MKFTVTECFSAISGFLAIKGHSAAIEQLPEKVNSEEIEGKLKDFSKDGAVDFAIDAQIHPLVGHKVPETSFIYTNDNYPYGPSLLSEQTTRTIKSPDLFIGKWSVIVALPGAYTPTCSNGQVPAYDSLANDFYGAGIDQILVLAVNSSAVMKNWFEDLEIKHLKTLPDVHGTFSSALELAVTHHNKGMGLRSWRSALIVGPDGVIRAVFSEDNQRNEPDSDPYLRSKPEQVLRLLVGSGNPCIAQTMCH